MHPRLRPLLLGVLLLASILSAQAALAFGRRGNDVRGRITQNVKKALDAVKATPQQRAQVKAAIDQVIATAEAAFGTQGMPELDELLAIFSRERLDPPAIDALRAKRAKRQDLLADALTQAFCDVHDALTAEQREILAAYARGRVEGKHLRRFKATLMEGFVHAVVEDLLDQLAATESERAVTRAARDQVIVALRGAQATQGAALDTLTSIFRGESVDKAALARFRAEKEAQIKSVTDTVQQALTQVHAALSHERRLKVVEIVRGRRAQHQRNATQAEGAGETGF